MFLIDATGLDHKKLNEKLGSVKESCTITDCLGQRFIGAGMSDKNIVIEGIPGNALGAYLNGADITVSGNAQDAVGDTMNDGRIVVFGNIGDAAGYTMRGGKLLIKGNAGYRAGIHMKAYKEKVPLMIIGGKTGSFLGEYQAGGIIIVLDLYGGQRPIVGNYPCTGMHGGKLFLRGECKEIRFPDQVTAVPAGKNEMDELRGYLTEFCDIFEFDLEKVLDSPFTVVTPDSKNPYRQMYVAN